MFYEMLTGNAPFDGVRMEAVLARKLTGKVPVLREARPDTPPTWQAVLQRVLAVDPEDRFPTPDAFVEALTAAMTRTAIAREERRTRRARGLRGFAAVGAVAAVAAVAIWFARTTGGPAMQTLAVLPATDGALDEAGLLVRGVAEDLTSELARAGLRVKDTRAVNRFIATDDTNEEIAAALGLDGIVVVSADLSRGTIGSQLTLVDPATDDIVWLDDFEAEERRVLTMVSEMALGVADAIDWPLEDEIRTRLAATAPEVDPEVRELLQRARFSWQSVTEEGFANADDYYRRALEASDSLSADAFAGVGSLYYMRSQMGLVTNAVARDSAAPFLARARELDPRNQVLAVAEAVRQTWSEWNWEAAGHAFEAALDANPRDAEMRAYHAQYLLYLGRDEEAAEEERLAYEADPLSSLVQGLRGQNLNARGLYQEAEATLLEAIERGNGLPYLLSTLRTTYHLMGRFEEALDIWRQTLTPDGAYTVAGDPEALEALELGYAEGGYSGALTAVAELNARRGGSPWGIGTLFTRAGREEEALDWLERAVEAGNQNSPSLAVDRIFDPLRDEPRFLALIDRLGLSR
jgi:tetratricopeptide (TPR) repeat protein/TolB-like protein